jgi:hypothetical protein
MRVMIAALVAACLVTSGLAAGPPQGGGTYEDFVALWGEFEAFSAPAAWNPNFNDPEAPDHGLADLTPPAIKARRKTLKGLRARLDNMNVAAWPRGRQAEYLAVRAEFDAEAFLIEVSRPWARDPGFYVDQLQRFAFTALPLDGATLAEFERELDAVPAIVAAAQGTLDDVAADYAALALRNLSSADGVGHGQPYRAVPPAGVVGWYEDLLAEARAKQPALVPKAEAALGAVAAFRDWLIANQSKFNAKAGVGTERYDWYLKHALLMTYSGDDLILLGERELARLTAWYAIARHRNRALPELAPARDAADYARRIAATDANIRKFRAREGILTTPDFVGKLDHNVPFIERPGGPNFWEAIQFRDPHPDHLHAVIPGHRFDQLIEDNNPHPIRGRISDGARTEGWAVYLEESHDAGRNPQEQAARRRADLPLRNLPRRARARRRENAAQ